jgi:hypothetical protein
LHAWPVAQSALELQPHVSFATHACPAALAAQSVHAVPDAPHADGDVPAWHEPPPQQPPEHGLPAEHPTWQTCVVVLQVPEAQFALLVPHPQKPPVADATQISPSGLAALQTEHEPPFWPHAALSVPATHVPPEQQPPLHGCVALHVEVHVFVDVSHAMSLGQSPLVAQPHLFTEPPTGMHALPPEPGAVQSVHVAVPVLHACGSLPPAHTPPPQHPPLQGCDALQLVTQLPPESQALPIAQSVVTAHPQLPGKTQTTPFGLARQLTHDPPDGPHVALPMDWHVLVESQQKPLPQSSDPPTVHADTQAPAEHVGVPPPHVVHDPPLAPHWVSAVPATHEVPLQQPPLHAVCEAPHADSHWPVDVLQD